MAFGGPMQGGPPQAPPGQPMSSAPPPAKPNPETIRKASSPTWDEVMAVLRSDKMRGYRIDIETDATVMQDAEAEKQSRIEFTQAASEMLQGAYQAMTVAPQMLPVIKELFQFNMRGFHAGRNIEETFEDAFDELAKNPPQMPQQGPAAPQGDPLAGDKLQLDVKRQEADAQASAADLGLKREQAAADVALKGKAADVAMQNEAARSALDRQKAEADAVLRGRELALKERAQALEEERFKLQVAQHNQQIVTEAMAARDAEQAAQAPVEDQGPQAADLIAQLAQAIVHGQETQAQAQRQLAEAIVQAQQAHSAQMQDLGTRMAAPKMIMRGPDGRAVGVQTAQ